MHAAPLVATGAHIMHDSTASNSLQCAVDHAACGSAPCSHVLRMSTSSAPDLATQGIVGVLDLRSFGFPLPTAGYDPEGVGCSTRAGAGSVGVSMPNAQVLHAQEEQRFFPPQ